MLPAKLDQITLLQKSKLSQEHQAVEHAEAFTQTRRAHSTVESAINALEMPVSANVWIMASMASSVTLL
ncbi:hypothetical protein [Nitrosomonas mobilis]|uniref:Uncharacterized protein n=1 Tax=Nitrosomonas mobilis TaxID=51642 RepID=A0A1G5SEH8_9PROT|nr:hypothetical protein [Nitrosomonas mobilis]SCZ85606.1 hypothetical protein NSMM_400084 [Nitrosomonas mobilis]HNO74926.1 hypothetical protein [Nitrosomonas mobilis]